MGRSTLKGLAVLHHRFDRERDLGAGEALVLGLLAGDHGDRQQRFGEVPVDVQHPAGLLERLGLGGVRRVALLPEELGGAQQHPRAELPADDVAPLVDQQRQVAVGVDPLGERVADDGLRGGTDDERLGKLGGGMQMPVRPLLEPVVGHHRHLLGEALDVLRLLLEVAQRDEEREVGVDGPGLLDRIVERALHELPDAVAPGTDHHRASHVIELRDLGVAHGALEPLREVLSASGGDPGFRLAFHILG